MISLTDFEDHLATLELLRELYERTRKIESDILELRKSINPEVRESLDKSIASILDNLQELVDSLEIKVSQLDIQLSAIERIKGSQE